MPKATNRRDSDLYFAIGAIIATLAVFMYTMHIYDAYRENAETPTGTQLEVR